MGADWSAISVIGCRVSTDKLYVTTTKKTCEHPFNKSFAFCPVCGKPATTASEEPQSFFDEGKEKIQDFDVLFIDNGDDPPTYAVIGALIATNGDYEEPLLTPLPNDVGETKERLRQALEPLGLWDTDQFGLWTILGCSY